MTRIYIERRIETVQGAAALPPGTVALSDHGQCVKAASDIWATDCGSREDADVVGWTALVPVEAVEQTTKPTYMPGGGTIHVGPTADVVREAPSRRLVTPWEEA